MRYKLTISYDGSAYSGWQKQLNGIAIQELIEQALTTLLRTPTVIHGSGRTDAGVHALGQTAHFDCLHEEPKRLQHSLNALLPKDIRILSLEPVASDFHARYSAIAKTYHYNLRLPSIADPFFAAYHYHVPHPVDMTLLEQAASYFIGTHDFTSFSHEAHAGSAARNPVRTLHRLNVMTDLPSVRLEFEGNGFLYKMVRNIVGTLLDVSCGKIPLNKLPHIFAAKDRCLAGRTAPPHGLFLMSVAYPQATPHAPLYTPEPPQPLPLVTIETPSKNPQTR